MATVLVEVITCLVSLSELILIYWYFMRLISIFCYFPVFFSGSVPRSIHDGAQKWYTNVNTTQLGDFSLIQ